MSSLVCRPCSQDGRTVGAAGFCKTCQEHLCDVCYQYHCRPTPTRHHVLLDKDHMPTEVPPSTVSETVFVDPCRDHPEEMVKFYCRGHEELACSVCVPLKHRTCENVDYIPSIAEDILNKQEFKDIADRLQSLVENVELTAKTIQIKRNAVDIFKDYAVEEMGILRVAMKEFMDNLEGKILATIHEIKKCDTKALDMLTEKCDNCMTELRTLTKGVDLKTQRKPSGQVFVTLSNAKEKLDSLSEQARDVYEENTRTQVTRYVFEPERRLINLRQIFTSVGNVTVKSEYLAKFEQDIVVKLDSEEEKCQLTGTAILPENKLVVCDSQNHSVKLIDLKQNKIVSQIHLGSKPWGITPISKDHLYATLIDEKKIVSIMVDEEELHADRDLDIEVEGRCCGITYSNKNLIVSFANPPKIEIMDIEGTVLKRISRDTTGQPLFNKPMHLALSPCKSLLYVSDWATRRVVCLTLDGIVMATYYSNQKMYGVSTDVSGCVYVGCTEPNSVHLLTTDCHLEKVLLEDRDLGWSPDSLVFDPRHMKLYVALYDQAYIREFLCQ